MLTRQVDSKEKVFKAIPISYLIPVSYTHLDVYKRQLRDWITAAGMGLSAWTQTCSIRRNASRSSLIG